MVGTEVRCPICSHPEFERQEVLVSAGVEADVVVSPSGDRSWTHRVKDGRKPVAEVCARCGYVLLFVSPE
jgi:predicted nucleic-acid-binding Zn-ribbon protein